MLIDVAVQPIAAEQHTVAIVHRLDEEVGGDIGLCAEAARDDIAMTVGARLLLG